ncbi:MAG TPA: zinc ribbon domain-containing protein [Phycisphaerales bacterium]|nr:zinc ribbon domain-containing protein [Phycisphaerales bacterium]
MPIYEYKCGKCGAVSEFLEGMSGKKKHVCEKCGSGNMEKQFSTFAVGVKQDGTDSKCMGCTDRGCPHSGM